MVVTLASLDYGANPAKNILASGENVVYVTLLTHFILYNTTMRIQDEKNQKTQYKRKKPTRCYGILLIVAFLIVPLIFIISYAMSTPTQGLETQQSTLSHSAPDSTGELPPHQPHTDELDLSQIETAEPEIEIIGAAYLTFDDGPSLTVTPAILDILAQEGIKATFFSLPYSGADEIFMRIINEGHEIGNHSYSHDYRNLYEGSTGAFREDILKVRRFISDNFGYETVSFRFPGGSGDQSRSTLKPRIDAINELGYRHFDWDIDTNDWRRGRSAEEITSDILNNTNGREHVIILMHDVYDRTLEALPGVIDGLRKQGYEFDILRNYPDT